MSELAVFDHPEFGSVRSVMIDGDSWFVLADVAKILGYQRASDAIKHLRDSQFNTADRRIGDELGLRGGRLPILITESGLYRLMLRSDAKNAERFQIWVEDEVLPEIRKTGGYGQVQQLSYPEALRAYADEVEAREVAEKQLAIAAPKAEVYDEWLESEAIEMTDYAKRIGFTPPTRFTRTLREIGVLRKDKTHTNRYRNLPTKQWEDAFEVRPVQIHNGEWIDLALVNTQGQLDILEELRDSGYEV